MACIHTLLDRLPVSLLIVAGLGTHLPRSRLLLQDGCQAGEKEVAHETKEHGSFVVLRVCCAAEAINTGPLEATIHNLGKEIEHKTKEGQELQRRWINKQTELVALQVGVTCLSGMICSQNSSCWLRRYAGWPYLIAQLVLSVLASSGSTHMSHLVILLGLMKYGNTMLCLPCRRLRTTAWLRR